MASMLSFRSRTDGAERVCGVCTVQAQRVLAAGIGGIEYNRVGRRTYGWEASGAPASQPAYKYPVRHHQFASTTTQHPRPRSSPLRWMLPGYLNCLALPWPRPLVSRPALPKKEALSTGGINGLVYMHTTVPVPARIIHAFTPPPRQLSQTASVLALQPSAEHTPPLPRPEKGHRALRQGCPRASRVATWLVRRC